MFTILRHRAAARRARLPGRWLPGALLSALLLPATTPVAMAIGAPAGPSPLAPGAAPAAPASAGTAARARGQVSIKRDRYGVPSIHADTLRGLYYGYGYALAEDRLFQIESVRRTAAGRAAEVFGEAYLERDIANVRNYDIDRLRPQLAALKGEHREVLDAMVDGINARIADVLADRARLLPQQFSTLGVLPEPWQDIDIAASFAGLLLIGFADNSQQVPNQALLEDLKAMHGAAAGEQLFHALRWDSDPASPTTVQAIDQAEGRATRGLQRQASGQALPARALSAAAAQAHSRFAQAVWSGDGPDRVPSASNTWLVNGDKLVDADAVMISGPQVGDRVPSMIWSASLHGAGLSVTGSTYPGLPYFHFGTNGDIAWGRTALAGSVIDVYHERLHPDDPHQYWHEGQWRKMERRVRTIRVKGGADVALELFETVHGDVVQFDEAQRTAYAKRRSWAGREIETMFAYYEEMKARDYPQWRAQIARKSNNQSQYFIDRQGNIAYQQAGRYPLRRAGHNVQLPSPGDGSMEWEGFQPFEYNASVFNPRQHYIANWNNRPSPDIPNSDTLLWSRMNRVDAINAELERKPALTVQEVWDVNRRASHASEQHRYFAELVARAVAAEPADSRVRQLGDAIVGWDGQESDADHSGRYDAIGEAVYYAWLQVALETVFTGLLPEQYLGGCERLTATYTCPYGQPVAASLLYFALAEGAGGSPRAQHDFLRGARPADFIRASLRDADRRMSGKFGPALAQWRSPVRPKRWTHLNPMGVPWAGEEEQKRYTPNQKRGTMNALFVFRDGQVSMCDAVPPGQSGFIAPDGRKDPHYEDQFDLYTQFGCKPRAVTPEQVDAATVQTRVLDY